MIEINLLPRAGGRAPRRRRAAAIKMPAMPALGAEPWALVLGGLGLLVLLGLGFGIWRTGVQQTELTRQIEEEVADSARFASTIDLMTALRARQDTIREKIEIIRQVDTRRYLWPHLMDEISRAVPAYTWLTALSSAESADSLVTGPVLTVQGRAGSTQALTRLMKNLEASPFIRDVTLVTSEQAEIEGRALQQFTLEARYEEPDSFAIETVPVVVLD